MRALLGRYLTMNGLDESIVQEAVELSNRIGYDVPVIYANITKTTHLLNHWRKRV
jgi:GDP-4-dehydro-6-deoxy-D-mannose reductase